MRLHAPRLFASARICAAIFVAFVASVHSAHFTRGTETAAQFGVHEISLSGTGAVANAFDTIATVTFTPPSGSDRAVTVHAFYDGGNTWRARAYVSEPGPWAWSSHSIADAGLHGQSGVFTVAPATDTAAALRGKLTRHPADPKAWATHDGRWFLNLSDTAYYLFNSASTQWRQFVSDAAARGVTSLRVNVAGALRQADKQQASDGWDRIFADASRQTLNLTAFQTDDARLEWMLNHHPGLYVQLIVTPEPSNGWSRDESVWAGLDATRRERFLRNIIARYAAWPQVFWLVTNDAFHGAGFPNNNAMVAEVGAYLAAHDPWRHIALRSSGRNRDQAFYFTTAPWANYVHLETSTALSADQVSAYASIPMHVFNGEDLYEQGSAVANDAYFFRRLFWAWTLSGASANYGGRWNSIVPYSQSGFTGLDSIAHLKNFFAGHRLSLAGWLPEDARASGPAGAKRVKLMRRADDRAFLLYHPNAAADGGSASLSPGVASLTLNNLPADDYALSWTRADTGVVHESTLAHSGGAVALAAPWAGVDVAAYLRPRQAPRRLIVDTDFRTDVDDLGSFAMLHGLADLGLVEIVGAVASTAGPHVVAAIDAVNTHRGRPDIPVALVRADLASGGDDPYAATLGNPANFPSDQTNAAAPDSTAFYRATLHAAPDASLHLVVIGGHNALRAFLRSEAHHNGDPIPLTGLQLAARKVASLTIMGGRFNSATYAENNIKRGIDAARDVAANWPGPVVYAGWEVGTGVLAGAALTDPASNPVARAYQIFWGSGGVGHIGNRDCWDQTAALYAAVGENFGDSTLFTLSAPHEISFTETGLTVATPAPAATRRYLVKAQTNADLGALVSDLMIGAVSSPPPAPAPVKLIFDSDYSTDCDDTGALAVLHALADLGEVEILATIASTSLAKAPGAIDVVNTYYNRPGIPVGVAHAGPAHSSAFVGHLYDNFPHDTPLAPQVPGAVDVYRRLLAAQPDGSVVIATVGYLTNIAALLRSGPDSHSPLDGSALVAAKVKEWVCMGGNFFTTSSNNVNFTRDADAAHHAITHFPGKITFLPREVASEPSPLRAGQELMGTPVANPVRAAYQRYHGGGTVIDRHVADPATVLYAVRGARDYWDLETTGSMIIKPDATFVWDPAGVRDHRYLVMKGGYGTYSNKDYVEGVIRALLARPPGGSSGPPPVPPPPVGGSSIALYTFDEPAGGPVLNHGDGGASLDLADTGGALGRSGQGAGGHGAPALEGRGHAFDVLASGDGSYHSGGSGSAVGGGLVTAGPVLQSSLQGADGAFTYEALVRLSGGVAAEQTILAHDGSADRGFLFRISAGRLSLYTGSGEVTATIPTDGPHAFASGKWFHVAVVYTGEEGVAGNLRFHWTSLDASPVAANQVGTATLANDLPGAVDNRLGVGTTTRNPFRFELVGLIDEVRLSGVAHTPETFALFAPPTAPADSSGDGIPDSWAIAHGFDPAVDIALGDPDGDGLPNLLEYALGLDPRSPDAASDGPVHFLNAGHLAIDVPRNPDAVHLVFTPQVSSDLSTWFSGPEHVTVLVDTPELFMARDNTPCSVLPRRFIRLQVSVAPPADSP